MLIIQTRAEIADRLGISEPTLRKRLKMLGIMHRGHLSPIELEIIVVRYGTKEKLQAMSKALKTGI